MKVDAKKNYSLVSFVFFFFCINIYRFTSIFKLLTSKRTNGRSKRKYGEDVTRIKLKFSNVRFKFVKEEVIEAQYNNTTRRRRSNNE